MVSESRWTSATARNEREERCRTFSSAETMIRFELGTELGQLPRAGDERFGSLSGRSPVMRAAFALLARAAESDATVLLEGETGTGKSQAARSVHRHSARGE